jgi:hypothetical protein
MTLSKKLQYQAIADLLAGLPVEARAQDFTGIRRVCWEAVRGVGEERGGVVVSEKMNWTRTSADERGGSRAEVYAAVIFEATAQHPERFEFLREMERVRPGTPWPRLMSLEEVSQEVGAVDWLWRGWMPRGFITLLGAVSGAGKSLVALDLCRRLLRGMPWPDGSPQEAHPGLPGIVYVEAEAAAQILVERARKWQLDLGRLFPFAPSGGDAIDLSRAEQREQLSELCTRTRPALVVVDSLASAYGRGLTTVQQVRGLLEYLAELAAEQEAALLLVHHLNKPGSRSERRSIADFFGSFYIPAMARSVLSLSVESAQRRRMEVVKSNLAAKPAPLRLEIRADGEEGVRLEWAPWDEGGSRATLLKGCEAWLLELLEGAPMRPCEVVRMGRERGYGRRMIYRARRRLGERVEDTRGRQHPRNAWSAKDAG